MDRATKLRHSNRGNGEALEGREEQESYANLEKSMTLMNQHRLHFLTTRG